MEKHPRNRTALLTFIAGYFSRKCACSPSKSMTQFKRCTSLTAPTMWFRTESFFFTAAGRDSYLCAGVQCPAMTNLNSVLKQLQQERTQLSAQLERLSNALSALNGTGDIRTERRMSVAGRARIAAAQRARWAKVKGRKVVSITAHKRKMSPAARRRIAAAQRARWAKWKKAQKKA
jgi:hypothetical protein